jgi:hypothetical protein
VLFKFYRNSNKYFVAHIFHHLIYKNVEPETNTKGQATQHGDRDKGIEIVYYEEKLVFTGSTGAAKAEQKFLLPARVTTSLTNLPRKDPFHLSSLSPHSPSVSTVSRGHPLSSLSVWNPSTVFCSRTLMSWPY